MGQPAALFILHWNRPDECLRTLQRFECQGLPLDICVIDNHSDLGNLQRLREGLPSHVRLLALEENMGWGRAFNAVLPEWIAGDGDICFLSAHDAKPFPDCLAMLVRTMQENPRIGIACPEYGVPAILRFSPLRCYRSEPIPYGTPGTSAAMDMPHGTMMAVRSQCLREIGLFDERYFAYGDEHDLGLRARRKGWLVTVVWGAITHNPETTTTTRLRSYLFARNSLLLVETYAGRSWAALRMFLMAPNALRFLGREEPFSGRARLAGMRDFLFRRFGPPPVK